MTNKSLVINLIKGVQVIGRVVDDSDLNNIKIINPGVQTYVGTMKLGELIDKFEVPVYSPTSNKGYQRNPKDFRVNAVKDRILQNPDDPTIFADSINLNIRLDPEDELLKRLLQPIDKKKQGPGSFFTFTYASALNQKFQIVDGQTRVLGAKGAIEETQTFSQFSKEKKLLDINVNINLTFTNKIYEEAYQFYLINTHSSKIPAEGAHRLLYDAYMNGDQNFALEINRDSRISEEIEWGKVTDLLLKKSPIWGRKIRDYNETAKNSGKRSTVTIRAMSRNLVKPVYIEITRNIPSSASISPDQYTCDLIEAFWSGLKSVYPGCDDTGSNIMKSSQAEVIFKINALLIKYYFNNTKFKKKFGSINDPKNYIPLFAEFFKIVHDTDGSGNKIVGEKNWSVGSSGSMGKYTSAAGKNIAFSKLEGFMKKSIENVFNIRL